MPGYMIGVLLRSGGVLCPRGAGHGGGERRAPSVASTSPVVGSGDVADAERACAGEEVWEDVTGTGGGCGDAAICMCDGDRLRGFRNEEHCRACS
jgi:hypothetical protein